MKTCSFRGARPYLPQQYHHYHGLFCYDEPQIRYGMTSCQQRTCHFCFPLPEIMTIRVRQQQQQYEAVVPFLLAQKHRFVNGYEAILNCPTVSFY